MTAILQVVVRPRALGLLAALCVWLLHVDAGADQTSRGARYTFSPAAHPSYPDAPAVSKLTDGASSSNFASGYVAWLGTGPVKLVVDLDNTVSISSARLHTISQNEYGIFFPTAIQVFTSSSWSGSISAADCTASGGWTAFGTAGAPPADTQGNSEYWATIAGQATARYVCFTVTPYLAPWGTLFVDELSVLFAPAGPGAPAPACRTGPAVGAGNQTGYYTGYYDGLCGQFVMQGYGYNYGGYCANAAYYAQYGGLGTTSTGVCAGGLSANYYAGAFHSQCRSAEYTYGIYDHLGSCTSSNTYASAGACTGCQPGSSSNSYTLSVGVTAGGGSVTASAAGIYGCTSSCTASVASGGAVTISATPNPGSTFAYWTGDCVGQGAVCTLTMSFNRSAQASFGTCAPSTSCTAQGRTCGTVFTGCTTETCGSYGGGCPAGQACSSSGQCTSPAAYAGFLDSVTCSVVRGWAWDANQPGASLSIDILDGTTLLATVAANQYRQDLANAGIGNGYHAFTWSPPGAFTTNRSLTARVSGSSYTLVGSPSAASCGCTPTTSCAAQGRACGSINNGCTTEVCGPSAGLCAGGATCGQDGQCHANGDDIDSSLVGLWKFDEGSGGYLADASGAGHGGSLNGGVSFVAGKVGAAALRFDGTGYVPVTVDVPESEYTWSAWFRTAAASGTILAVVDPIGPYAGAYDRTLGVANGRVCHRIWSEETYCSPGTYNDDRWHLVVVTVGSAGGRLYVDGTRVAAGSKTSSDFGWQTGIVIGWHAYSQGAFVGSVDDVRVYRKVLSDAGVQSLLATGGCMPTTTCALQGRDCGTIWDGCNVVTCGVYGGSCAAGASCQAGVCGCQPTTSCASQGRTCGTVNTGCSVEACGPYGGSCPAGEVCNGAGQCTCSPSCLNKTCGQDDGCGGTCCGGSGCTPIACPACQQANACGSGCAAVADSDPPALCSGGICQRGACNIVGELLCDGSRASLSAAPRIDQMVCGVGSLGNALAIHFLGQWFTLDQGVGGGWSVANAVIGASPLGVSPQVHDYVEYSDSDFTSERDAQRERSSGSAGPTITHRIRTYTVDINGRTFTLKAEQVLYDQRVDLPSRALDVDGDLIFTLTSSDPADGAVWTVLATPKRLVPGVDPTSIEGQAENADPSSQIGSSGTLFNQRNTVFAPDVELSSAIKRGGRSTTQLAVTTNAALNDALDQVMFAGEQLRYSNYQPEAVNITGFLSAVTGSQTRFYDKTRQSQFFMNTRSSSGFSNPGTDRPLIETANQSTGYAWTLRQPIVDYTVYWPFLAGICGLSAGVHGSIDGSFQAGADTCLGGVSAAAYVRGNLAFDLSAAGGFGCNIVVASASAGLSAGVAETLDFSSQVQSLPPKISAAVSFYASASFSAFFKVRVLFWSHKWQKDLSNTVVFQKQASYEVDIPGLPDGDLDHDCYDDCSQAENLDCGCGDHDGDCFDDCSGIPGPCGCADDGLDFVNDCTGQPMTLNTFPWGQYFAPGGRPTTGDLLGLTILPVGSSRYIVQVQTTRNWFQAPVNYTPKAGDPERPTVPGNWIRALDDARLTNEETQLVRAFVATLGRWDGARPALEQAMSNPRVGITTTNQRAAFVAMVAGESGFLDTAEYYPKGADPVAYFEGMYGRYSARGPGLGNTEPNDGYRFRGRGPIQLTGRGVYRAVSQGLFGDDRLLDDPDQVVNDRATGMLTSAYYFAHVACRGGVCATDLAEQDNFDQVIRIVASGRPTGPLPASNVVLRKIWYVFFRDNIFYVPPP